MADDVNKVHQNQKIDVLGTYSLPSIAFLSSWTLWRDTHNYLGKRTQQRTVLKRICVSLRRTALPLGPIIPTAPTTPTLPW